MVVDGFSVPWAAPNVPLNKVLLPVDAAAPPNIPDVAAGAKLGISVYWLPVWPVETGGTTVLPTSIGCFVLLFPVAVPVPPNNTEEAVSF